MNDFGGPWAREPLTIGVEEEFLLVDPETREPVAMAPQVTAHLPAELLDRSRPEFRPSMLEMVTPVCTGLGELSEHLRTGRQAAARAGIAAGVRLMAAGIAPTRDPVRQVTPKRRYRRIVAEYGAIAQDPGVCGVHVHVGVPDREVAVAVGNHLRPWLPVIQALAANSPIHDGADTGHASWRSIQLGRWPSLGPAPFFGSLADYDRTVAALIDSGAILDESMVYWLSRLSAKYPTIEVRVADACITAAETVLVAALIRGLVATAMDDIRDGVQPRPTPDCVLAAAHWRAAREGLEGTLIDVRTGKRVPAWRLVEELAATVRPALDRHRDTATVDRLLADLRGHGSGAARQRAIFARTGDARAITDYLVGNTADLHSALLATG